MINQDRTVNTSRNVATPSAHRKYVSRHLTSFPAVNQIIKGSSLFASTVWALMEVGLDWWQLVPRLALWFAIGIVLLLPWFRRPVLRGQSAPHHGPVDP